jgi:hypothetical protein
MAYLLTELFIQHSFLMKSTVYKYIEGQSYTSNRKDESNKMKANDECKTQGTISETFVIHTTTFYLYFQAFCGLLFLFLDWTVRAL